MNPGIEEKISGYFDDALTRAEPDRVRRVILCSGKVYYDLHTERAARLGGASGDVALVRIEELYPWPEQRLAEIAQRYGHSERICWVP